jgi:SAM-dependent methyltransferase
MQTTGRRQGLSLYSPGVNPSKVALIDRYGIGPSLLDVGCGNGLYPLRTSRRYLAVLQIDLVDRRDSSAQGLPFTAMDAANIGALSGQQFSTVLAFDIIEHLDDDLAVLRDLRRLCGGVLIGSVPAAEDDRLRKIGLTNVHHVDKTHRREYRRDELRETLSSIGFSSVMVFPQMCNGLVSAPYGLCTTSLTSRAIARGLSLAMRGLVRAGVFCNQTVADWFFVAQSSVQRESL